MALVAAALIWRLASAVAWPRIVPANRFAPLSHMLMNGFFFNQGFGMSGSSREQCDQNDDRDGYAEKQQQK